MHQGTVAPFARLGPRCPSSQPRVRTSRVPAEPPVGHGMREGDQLVLLPPHTFAASRFGASQLTRRAGCPKLRLPGVPQHGQCVYYVWPKVARLEKMCYGYHDAAAFYCTTNTFIEGKCVRGLKCYVWPFKKQWSLVDTTLHDMFSGLVHFLFILSRLPLEIVHFRAFNTIKFLPKIG